MANYNAEDELVSLDELQEKIAEFEDHVQSSDVAAMQSKRPRLDRVERVSDLISQSCKVWE
jgi:EF-1 guanine nucleotide exchange domain